MPFDFGAFRRKRLISKVMVGAERLELPTYAL